MSDARSGSTSVRSLLAKFENNANNNSTSPPSRGRSPTGRNDGGSDRPLSKVRASFVAVERVASPHNQGGPQQLWGLRKASDVVSSPDNPKVEGLGSPLNRSAAVSPTNSANKPALERVPTLSPPSSVADMKNNLEAKSKSTAEESSVGSPTREKNESVDEFPRKNSTEPEEEGVAPASKVEEKPKETTVPKKQSTATTTKTARPSSIATGKDASKVAPSKRSPRDPKSPPLPRTPRTPATSGQRQASTTTNTPVGKKETERPSRFTSKRPSTTRASSHPAGGRTVSKTRGQPSGLIKENNGGRASTNTSPGSVRGKPKAPTRPVCLPASITATTASSAAKLKSDAQASRPGSRATGATATTNKAPPAKGPAANLRQANSTIRKAASHASLAPAAKISERPRSRVSNVTSKRPDDSFLARMMRPTASSASKAHEKVEIKSPPRSTVRKTPPQRNVFGKQQSGRQSAQLKTSPRASIDEAPVTTGEAVTSPKEEKPAALPEPEQLPPMQEVEEPKEEKAPEEIPLPAETEAEI